MGALRGIGRQQAGFGFELVQVFRDGQRVPDFQSIVGQARHQE